jgi:hypothetical protein
MTALINPYRKARDLYWSSVVLLLRTDGTLTELTGKPSAVTPVSSGGSPVGIISLAGPTGLYATSYAQPDTTGGDSHYIRAYSADATNKYYEFLADFTFEAWVRYTNFVNNMALIGGHANYPNAGTFAIQSGGTNNIGISFGDGPTFIFSPASTLVTNTWYHIAVTRSGTTVRVFVDGTEVASGTRSGTVNPYSGSAHVDVGAGIASDNPSFRGSWQEWRITKGVARYTANFTRPSAPFPSSGP